MRCVSKSWNVLLSHPSFVKSHLHHSINKSDRILLGFHKDPPRDNYRPFTAYSSRSPELKFNDFIKLPHGPGHTNTRILVIGSVHGLICFCYGADDTIHIWNPSLSLVSTLPPYSFPDCRCYEILLRFGFDPNTNDYKAIKTTGLKGPLIQEETSSDEDDNGHSYLIRKWLAVEIYSMRKGSWKLVTHRIPSDITGIYNSDDICADGHAGHLHWVANTNGSLDAEVILAFDLGSETFLEMNLLDPELEYNHANHLGVLGGKLCVMSRDGDAESIDVWVMEEYGVSESWVKRHVFFFSYSLDYDILVAFTSHNEFLIEDSDDHLVLYDSIADKAKILEKSLRAKHGVDRIVEYVESLVWVTPPPKIS